MPIPHSHDNVNQGGKGESSSSCCRDALNVHWVLAGHNCGAEAAEKVKPLVSICIVTYNQVKFIAEAITSAVNQDYENLEIVVADDGSTDGTADVVLEYAARYPERVKPVVGEPNLGIAGNCNRALRACKGVYIAWLAGDDIFYPDKVRMQVDWFEANSARVLCGHAVEIFDANTRDTVRVINRVLPKRQGKGTEDVIRHCVRGGSWLMVRRESVPEYGFDERLSAASDWKFVIDCLAGGGEYGQIDGVYSGYRKHYHSLSAVEPETVVKDIIITISLVEAQYPQYLRACLDSRSNRFLWMGIRYLMSGDKARGKNCVEAASMYLSFRNLWKYPLYRLLILLPVKTIKKTYEIAQKIRT